MTVVVIFVLYQALFNQGGEIPRPESGRNVTLDAPLENLNLHLRGGNIIPVQKPGNTTKTRFSAI